MYVTLDWLLGEKRKFCSRMHKSDTMMFQHNFESYVTKLSYQQSMQLLIVYWFVYTRYYVLGKS